VLRCKVREAVVSADTSLGQHPCSETNCRFNFRQLVVCVCLPVEWNGDEKADLYKHELLESLREGLPQRHRDCFQAVAERSSSSGICLLAPAFLLEISSQPVTKPARWRNFKTL
jgi:hypothetical protein